MYIYIYTFYILIIYIYILCIYIYIYQDVFYAYVFNVYVYVHTHKHINTLTRKYTRNTLSWRPGLLRAFSIRRSWRTAWRAWRRRTRRSRKGTQCSVCNMYIYIYIIKCHKMSFYNIYVYVVTILVSRSCYAIYMLMHCHVQDVLRGNVSQYISVAGWHTQFTNITEIAVCVKDKATMDVWVNRSTPCVEILWANTSH